MEVDLRRGDLTEVERRVLKGLLPIESENRVRGRLPEQIVPSLMGYSGGSGAALHGEMSLPNRVVGIRYDALIDLPEQAPGALLSDKGYDANAIRTDLAQRKINSVIPGRSNRRVKIYYHRTLYKQRNGIERMFGHLKINRAIAIRYDQLASSFLGMVHTATAKYWRKFVHAPSNFNILKGNRPSATGKYAMGVNNFCHLS